MKYLMQLMAVIAALWICPAWAGEVVASIKPLHSLVAAVMQGSGQEPVLLVDGKSSPHDFMLRPSQMQALAQADIVFYLGDTFETFLVPVTKQLPASTRRVAMEMLPGMTLYPLRVSGNFEADDDDIGAHDLHLWLDPHNAEIMVTAIAAQLSALYPQHRTLYEKNAQALQEKLEALNAQLKIRLRPLAGKPFIVFHDAYQYFEKAYGLAAVGSITLLPERPPSARHMRDLRRKVTATGALCVFREPQFDSRVVDNLLAGTKARSAILDPEGALLAPGPDLYIKLMDALASGLASCLR